MYTCIVYVYKIYVHIIEPWIALLRKLNMSMWRLLGILMSIRSFWWFSFGILGGKIRLNENPLNLSNMRNSLSPEYRTTYLFCVYVGHSSGSSEEKNAKFKAPTSIFQTKNLKGKIEWTNPLKFNSNFVKQLDFMDFGWTYSHRGSGAASFTRGKRFPGFGKLLEFPAAVDGSEILRENHRGWKKLSI